MDIIVQEHCKPQTGDRKCVRRVQQVVSVRMTVSREQASNIERINNAGSVVEAQRGNCITEYGCEKLINQDEDRLVRVKMR